MVASDDVSEAPSDVKGVDEARLDEGKTGVRSSSLTSRSDEEAWPEGARASVRSSGAWHRQIPTQNV
jgi:hypothetical protein